MRDLILILVFGVFFMSCANQLPPGGGPIDTKPPAVIKTFPVSGTLNFDKSFVEFEFSEYINKRTVINSIFISPYFKDEPELKWSGRKLRVIFPERLKENKTYLITIGTDVADLRGNKLAESISLIFSTGSKIDEGIIAGKVFDKNPQGILIFFYLIDSLNQEVRYDSVRPDFICQTSRDGSFYLSGLPDGIFRITAVRDQMRNLLYDINEDEIGLPAKDFILSDSIRKIDNVFFELSKIDTIKPVVNSVKFEDLNHIRVNFNEPIDISTVSLDNVLILDSLNGLLKVFGFFASDKNSLQLVTEKMKANFDYVIKLKGIKDLAGNEMLDSELKFYTEDIIDTIPINLKKIDCNFSPNVMEYFAPICTLYFNDFVPAEYFHTALSVEDTAGRKINFQISRSDSSNFILRFNELKQKEKIVLKIDFSLLPDAAGSRIDSTITKIIETNSESDYGSISGIIKNRNIVGELRLDAKNLNREKYYSIKIEDDKYQIKNVLPDSYLIKLFVPKDGNSKKLIDFASPFIYHPDTVKVKSRWPTTDVNFDAKELIR